LATIGVFVFGMTTTAFADDPPQMVTLDFDPNGGSFEGKAPGEHLVIETEYKGPKAYQYKDILPEPTKDGYMVQNWYNKEDDSGYDINIDPSITTPQGIYVTWERDYKIISGDNQTFYTESSDDLVVKINGDINDYVGVEVKKITGPGSRTPVYLGNDDYTVTEGSVIATLKNSYLKTLQPGDYVFIVSFENPLDPTDYGDGIAYFTVVEGAAPVDPTQDPTLSDDTTVPADSDTSQSTTPKTGDNSNVVAYVSTAMAAIAGISVVVVFKKKSNA